MIRFVSITLFRKSLEALLKVKRGVYSGVLNFSDATFEYGNITVKKDKTSRDIKSYITSDSLSQFLKENGVLRCKYDENSIRSPRDYETILSDANLFQLTNEPLQNKRKVYRRIGFDELWYVDDAHFDTNAHIEVFSSKSRRQIAVSCVNDIDNFRPLKSEEKNRTI